MVFILLSISSSEVVVTYLLHSIGVVEAYMRFSNNAGGNVERKRGKHVQNLIKE